MKSVVIFGIGSFADQVLYYFEQDSPYKVAAFSVNKDYIKETSFHGRPIVPFETLEQEFPPAQYDMFVAMGYSDLNQRRAERIRMVREKGYKMVNYKHSSASISKDLVCGESCIFFEHVVIHPNSKIGDGVVILQATAFGHDVQIGDCCYISGGCSIAANVTIGPYCFFSLNTTIRPKVTVGKSVILGAGALLLEDAPDESVYIPKGTPRAPRTSRIYQKFI